MRTRPKLYKYDYPTWVSPTLAIQYPDGFVEFLPPMSWSNAWEESGFSGHEGKLENIRCGHRRPFKLIGTL